MPDLYGNLTTVLASARTRVQFALQRADLERKSALANWRFSGRPAGLAEALATTLRQPRFVLALSHSNYLRNVGGTELYLRQEQSFLATRAISYVQLSPVSDGSDEIEVNVDGQPSGRHALAMLQPALAELRAPGRGCIAVHLHHTKGWRMESVQPLVTRVGAPRLRFFLHDYYSLCRNFNLLFANDSYCGAPALDSNSCTVCRFGSDRAAHQARFATLLAAMADAGELELIAPSEAAASLFRARWPHHAARIRVVPHQETRDDGSATPHRDPRPSLGFVGYSDRCKGFAQWLQVSSLPSIRERYRLFHFGACGIPRPYVRTVDVSFQASGPDAMRRALTQHQLDFAFLWSIWPETFSFTCYEAMAAGAFVLTGAVSGNIAAQVEARDRGRVFPDLEALERFLLDDKAVAAARSRIVGMPRLALRWNESLSEELRQAQ